METKPKKRRCKFHIGEIAEILDLFGNGSDGASKRELSEIFNTTTLTITRIIKDYSDEWKENQLEDYIVKN